MAPSREPRGRDGRSLDWAKFALALVGMLIWGYGVHVDDARVRWGGIAVLAVAFLLRFMRSRTRRE